MLLPSRGRRIAWLALLVVLIAPGCVRRLPDVTPADIPEIRTRLQERPGDLDLRTRLGVALHNAGEHAQAVEVLEAAVRDGARSGAAFLYLGLSHEALEAWEGARTAYSSYLEVGRFDALRGQLRDRLTLMVREELADEARDAVANEAQLAAQPPAARTLAVFPLRWVQGPAELEPLRLAMADMMITDLGRVGGLTVLERTRVQSLLDEMALTEAGLTEPGSGARAGRLLRSEHVVQGALTALGTEGLRLDADLRHTVEGTSTGQVAAEEPLAALFDLEKAAVFRILEALGIPLTPQERAAIDENRTGNLQAFLAYGRGLEALDRRDYPAARQLFLDARELDPGFGPAEDRQEEAAQLERAAETSIQQVAQLGVQELGEGALATLAGIGQAVDPTLNSSTLDRAAPPPVALSPEQMEQERQMRRNALNEAMGQNPLGSLNTRIRILVPRPGSGGGL